MSLFYQMMGAARAASSKFRESQAAAFSQSFRGAIVNAKTLGRCAFVIECGIAVTAFDMAEKSDNAVRQPLRELP